MRGRVFGSGEVPFAALAHEVERQIGVATGSYRRCLQVPRARRPPFAGRNKWVVFTCEVGIILRADCEPKTPDRRLRHPAGARSSRSP